MRLSRLLATPAVRPLIPPAELVRDGSIRHVLAVEDFAELAASPPDSLVVLTRGLSQELRGYRFDIAMRQAAETGLVAIVHHGAAPEPALSSVAIAHRAGISLLRAGEGVTASQVVLAAGRELAGDTFAALHRGSRAVAELRRAEAAQRSDEDLIHVAASALGVPLTVSDEPHGLASVAVRIDDEVRYWINAETGGDDALASMTEIVLEALTAAVARAVARRQRAESGPMRSRGQILTELLTGDPARQAEVLSRARAAGLHVDGWHLVAQLEVENLTELADGDETHAHDLLESVAGITVKTARAVHPDWHRSVSVSGVTMVRMFRVDPGQRARSLCTAVISQALTRTLERHPDLRIRCGVGGLHTGPAGLVTSYAEARTALAEARTTNRINTPVAFDSNELRRTLAEWYHASTARYAVESVLEPLDQLGPRAQDAVRTLQVYLDNMGSLQRTAELLHLHRNSVAYRLKKIFELLDVNPDDPDDRLLLQLACRARLMR